MERKYFCNGIWACDPETRVNVTVFIIYLLNLPICWRSKSQKGLTLLSTEAEYVAISEAFKQVKFVYYLLCDLHIKVNLPIVVRTNNIGAIIMSENALTGFCTWHMETRYHIIREFIEDGFLRTSLSVQTKMIVIYLPKTLVRSYMKDIQRNFWKTAEIAVPFDRYRIGRVLKISLAINHLVLQV
jgi:hypothetical protein